MELCTPPDKRELFLVADDDDNDVFFLRRAFARANPHNVSLGFVADGEQTVDYIAGKDRYSDRQTYPIPSLLLLDLNMPRAGGFELLDWLDSNRDLVRFPIVIFTGSSNPEDHRVATSFDFVIAYLFKSNTFDHLPELLQQLRVSGQRQDFPFPGSGWLSCN